MLSGPSPRGGLLFRALLLGLLFASSATILTAQQLKPDVIRLAKEATALVLGSDGKGMGTAFCIDDKGYFVTNDHVISGNRKLWLVLNSGSELPLKVMAEVVRLSADDDLAILRVDAEMTFTALEIAPDDALVETSTIVALGFPYGEDILGKNEFPSVSINVARVTSLRRSKGALDLIQFDSQLNPGNSGGPVINTDGKLVGVAQAILVGVTEAGVMNSGINFAIPARKVINLLRKPLLEITRLQLPSPASPMAIEFTLSHFHTFRLTDQRVAARLTVDSQETITPLASENGHAYFFKADVPMLVNANEESFAKLSIGNDRIHGALSNASAKLPGLEIALSDVTSIDRVDEQYRLRLTTGKELLTATLTPLELAFSVGGQPLKLAVSQFDQLVIRHPRMTSIPAVLEIQVFDGDTLVESWTRRLNGSGGLTPRDDADAKDHYLYSRDHLVSGKHLNLTQELTVAAAGGAEQIIPIPDQRIVVMRSAAMIHLVDSGSGEILQAYQSKEKFTDMDISPDGKAIFVADYGNVRIGYGEPIRPHHVHRLDLETGEWQVAQAPKVAWKIEALSATVFVLQEFDQWIDVTLNEWNSERATVTEINRARCDYSGDSEYNPFTGHLLHGNSGISRSSVTTFRVTHKGFGTKSQAESKPGYSRGPVTLNTDGRYLFHDNQQVDALNPKIRGKTFPGNVVAASVDMAMTLDDVCDIETGTVLQKWGYKPSAIGVSLIGEQVVTFSNEEQKLRIYEVTP